MIRSNHAPIIQLRIRLVKRNYGSETKLYRTLVLANHADICDKESSRKRRDPDVDVRLHCPRN